VRFAGHLSRTRAGGRTRICVRMTRAGRRTARASKSGYRSARAAVRVVRGSRFTG
jgi:hypothetical protein